MENKLTKRREPFKFMLILGIVSSSLLFAFILMVFIKKELANQDIPVQMPKIFWLSTFSILISSFTIFGAEKAIAKENFKQYRNLVSITWVLSLIFIVCQLMGWQIMYGKSVTPANNTGGAFIYILSGLHILHTLGGVVALSYLLRDAFRNLSYVDSFVYSVNPPNQLRISLIGYYWHFVDVVWLVIFMFFLWHAT